ncbi:MFS transporter [Raoultibacter phocaeensis]|uniref:MFS transporter n=1 Tax=Raoultibacter phocaeensis TaxID=2479841 RepID=UPI00111B0E99|nr:MFS transporter [Raoultibacter phocaeensis]
MALVRDGRLFGTIHYAFVIMVCCCFVQAFGMGLILNCGSLFYVPVCEDLGFLRSEISTYMTGYFIGTTLVTPLAGKLLSKYDTRVVMSVAIVVLSGAVVAMSTYTEIWQWQVSGFLVGAAGAGIFVLPSASLIGNWFIKRRGFVYGIVMACSGISATVFSMVISSLIQTAGWRSAYVFVGVASLVVILPCSLLMRKKPTDLGIAPYGYQAEVQDGKEKLPVMRGVAVKVAVASLAFWCLFVFAGIASFIHGGIEQHMPGYIQSIGFTASFAAIIVSAESAESVVDKLVMGWLNDKIGVRKTTIIELVLIFVGIAGFIVFKNPVFLILSTFLFGIQDSLMSVSLPLLIRDLFGSKNYTQIHAWIRTGVGLFGSFSGVLVGAVYDSTGTFVPAFAGLMGTCVLAIGCVALAYRSRKKLVWTADDGTPCEHRDIVQA